MNDDQRWATVEVKLRGSGLTRRINNVKNSAFAQNLKRQMDENPVMVLVAVAGVITAGAKLIKAYGDSKGSRAYAKQVQHRINKSK